MNNTLGAVLVFVSIFTASLALGDDKEANRSDLGRWKGESDSIWSYDITMDVIGYALSDTKLTPVDWHSLRQRFSQGQWRVDILMSRRRYESGKEEVWSSDGRVNAFSFNGKQVKFFSSNSAFGEIKGPGPDMETRVKVLAPQFYEFFRSTYNGIELYEILEPRLKQSTRAVLDSGVSLSFPALGVGRSQADVSDDYVVEVSKEAGGLPVRIRHGVGLLRHPTVVTEMKIQWSGVTPTKWVPRKLEQWVYAKSKPTGLESPAGGYEMIVRQDMAQVNIDMLGEVFDLPFPAGTTVHDKPKGVNYVINDGGDADYRAFAKVAQKLARDMTESKARKESRPSRLVSLLLANIALIASFAIIAWRARSARMRPK